MGLFFTWASSHFQKRFLYSFHGNASERVAATRETPKMNFKMTKQTILVITLMGVSAALYAAAAVTGNDAPGIYRKPPTVKAVNDFMKAHQTTGVTPDDATQFAADIERGDDATVTPNTIAMPSDTSTVGHCPSGFITRQYSSRTGYAACEQDTPLPDGTTLVSNLTWHSMANGKGEGLVQYSNFGAGDSSPIPYGVIYQTIVGERPDHTSYPVEYDNYFFQNNGDAVNVAELECRQNFRVTYVGPSGKVNKKGKPSGGYQVQVAKTEEAPLPSWDVDYCLTHPPISN